MESAIELQDNDDLAFFGKVNASISHELKNILAIISETAGFLNDLTEMASEGKDIDLETLKRCSRDIVEEIQRGFVTIKQMNRFSHSVDDPFKSVNLVEILELMVGLAGFLSFASNVRFDPQEEAAPVVLTCPFRLQNLIYQAVVFAFESAGPDGEIHVSIHPEKNGNVRIHFSGFGPMGARTFPTEKTTRIAETIGAQICTSADSQAFDILLPVKAGRRV
jgi:signal transduction histidine kinase